MQHRYSLAYSFSIPSALPVYIHLNLKYQIKSNNYNLIEIKISIYVTMRECANSSTLADNSPNTLLIGFNRRVFLVKRENTDCTVYLSERASAF